MRLHTLGEWSDLGVDFEDIAVRVTKEQRAMAKCLVGRRMNDDDPAFGECRGTQIHFMRCHSECQLQRQHADRRCRIIEARIALGQRQDVRTNAKLDPSWREFPVQGEPHGGAIELAHLGHLTRKDDGIVETSNREPGIHPQFPSQTQVRRCQLPPSLIKLSSSWNVDGLGGRYGTGRSTGFTVGVGIGNGWPFREIEPWRLYRSPALPSAPPCRCDDFYRAP